MAKAKKKNYNFDMQSSRRQNVKILSCSENFLILEKPYDMVINSNDPENQNTLQIEIRRLFPNLANPKLRHEFYFVHRLDYATSGVMCVALNKQSARQASSAFEMRQVKKYYLALVHGHLNVDSLIIDKSVGEDPREKNGNRMMCTEDDEICEKPRKCRTAVLVLERGLRNDKPVTKVLLRPGTGRRHQLRVHCRYIGHTIVGDYTYSDRKDCEPHRTFLHSYRLIIDTANETIDETTMDPFVSEDSSNLWIPKNFVRSIDDNVFVEIDRLLIV